jgi:hypothetical protein
LCVSGGLFESSFPEPSSISAAHAEDEVLRKLVSDYNSSGNPGKFAVRQEPAGRYAVIGIARRDHTGKEETVNAMLDATSSFPVERRDARATLQLIADTLTVNSGVKVYLGTIGLSSDPVEEAELSVGGTDVPAGTRLQEALEDVSTTSPHFRGVFVMELPVRRRYQCLLAAPAAGDENRHRRCRKESHSVHSAGTSLAP